MPIRRRPARRRHCPLQSGLIALLLILALPLQAEPGRALLQETATTAEPGRIHIDLVNGTGGATRASPSLVRVGSRAGEWQIAMDALGFKYPVGRAVAVYGRLGLDTGAGRSDAVAGLAWSGHSGRLYLNLNPELSKTGDTPHLYLNGAARLGLPLPAGQPGRLAGILEASLSDEAGKELAIAGGLRWQPHPALTVDAVLLTAGPVNGIGTPTALRLCLNL